jgi:hypothetical protein
MHQVVGQLVPNQFHNMDILVTERDRLTVETAFCMHCVISSINYVDTDDEDNNEDD